MNRKISVLIFIIFFCLGCGDSIKVNTSIGYNWSLPNKDNWNYQWVKGDQNSYKLNEYAPKMFLGTSSLRKLWINNEMKCDHNKIKIQSLDAGWLVDSSCVYRNKPFKGIIDPLNGNFEDELEIYPFLGVYDGSNVYGVNLFRQSCSANTWNLKTKQIVWSNCLSNPGASFYIINGKLIHYTNSGGVTLSKVDHCTGEVLWQISNKDIFDELIIKTDSYLVIIGKNQKGIIQLYRINPDSEKVMTYEFKAKNGKYSMTASNSYIWIAFDNQLIEFDVEQLIEKSSFEIPSTQFIASIGQKIILLNYEKKEYYMFDSTTESIINLDTLSAKVINNSLIFEDEKQIRGIDPETLETTWWIDLDEDMKNAHVEWLDWRGVLVVSDNEIACYAPKK